MSEMWVSASVAQWYGFGDEAGYYREEMALYLAPEPAQSGGGGLWSTSTDYNKFLNMLANMGTSSDGVKIMEPETARHLLEEYPHDIMALDFMGLIDNQGWKHSLSG